VEAILVVQIYMNKMSDRLEQKFNQIIAILATTHTTAAVASPPRKISHTTKNPADGFEVVVFIDANEPIYHSVRGHKYKSNNGFHIDGSINGSIATYIRNCGLSNILAECLA
jgi:hypothetical protein